MERGNMSNSDRLSGEIAVVTGAGGAKGIGASIVRRLYGEGAQVLATGRRTLTEQQLEEVLPDKGERRGVDYLPLDVTSEQGWREIVVECERRFGAPSILVNNAGMVRMEGAHEETSEGWHTVLEVNLSGAFYGMRSVLPAMRERRHGSIVNISSIW